MRDYNVCHLKDDALACAVAGCVGGGTGELDRRIGSCVNRRLEREGTARRRDRRSEGKSQIPCCCAGGDTNDARHPHIVSSGDRGAAGFTRFVEGRLAGAGQGINRRRNTIPHRHGTEQSLADVAGCIPDRGSKLNAATLGNGRRHGKGKACGKTLAGAVRLRLGGNNLTGGGQGNLLHSQVVGSNNGYRQGCTCIDRTPLGRGGDRYLRYYYISHLKIDALARAVAGGIDGRAGELDRRIGNGVSWGYKGEVAANGCKRRSKSKGMAPSCRADRIAGDTCHAHIVCGGDRCAAGFTRLVECCLSRAGKPGDGWRYDVKHGNSLHCRCADITAAVLRGCSESDRTTLGNSCRQREGKARDKAFAEAVALGLGGNQFTVGGQGDIFGEKVVRRLDCYRQDCAGRYRAAINRGCDSNLWRRICLDIEIEESRDAPVPHFVLGNRFDIDRSYLIQSQDHGKRC